MQLQCLFVTPPNNFGAISLGFHKVKEIPKDLGWDSSLRDESHSGGTSFHWLFKKYYEEDKIGPPT